jgi:hypothetical protein
MNRETRDSQSHDSLPQGFWSQASSEQLHRLESLLQQFLSLPGFQKALENNQTTPPDPAAYPPAHHETVPASKAPASPEWSPSGSTWGPLAEAWKLVQQEKQPLKTTVQAGGPGAPPDRGHFPEWPERESQRDKAQAQVPVWHSGPVSPLPNATVSPWNNLTEELGKQEIQPASMAPSPWSALEDKNPTSAPPSAGEKASIPVQPGWTYQVLLGGNRLADAGFRMMGWPGRAIQSSPGKWFVGLVGIFLLASGTWLYFREAVDELMGQFHLSEPASP